jgi:trans-2,3-dihydro-3-hydroxyanthranilate isomerase
VSRAFQLWDVFTDEPLLGNQLAVFGDGRGFDPASMQRVAREMNLSETTFVLPPIQAECDVRVRIFTPLQELPMAGHPTIGTTFALAQQGRIPPDRHSVTLELGIGPTLVELDWHGDRLRFAWMTQQQPTFGQTVTDLSLAAAALGLDVVDVRSDVPVQVVSCGQPFLFVPLRDSRAVDRAACETTALTALAAAIGAGLPLFVFAVLPAGDSDTTYSRMFAPGLGIVEDPATGGATGPLGSYLLRHGLVDSAAARQMTSVQGVAMGRRSRLHMSIEGTPERITRVRVGGTAVLVGQGELFL